MTPLLNCVLLVVPLLLPAPLDHIKIFSNGRSSPSKRQTTETVKIWIFVYLRAAKIWDMVLMRCFVLLNVAVRYPTGLESRSRPRPGAEEGFDDVEGALPLEEENSVG